MSVIGSNILAGAAGSGSGTAKTYVDDVFSTFLYDGTGAAQTITNGIDLSGEGGMVLQRRRSAGYWFLNDTENGANNFLYTNFTNALSAGTSGSSFNSDGFTIGAESNLHNTGDEVVSWTFRKAPGFFDVVTYTGNATARQIAHSLGCVPGFIAVKNLDNDNPWRCYHSATGNTDYLHLNTNADANTSSSTWNNTSPTSTHFTVGTEADVNRSGDSFVAYIWADGSDAGSAVFGTNGNEKIIKCGSYTGTSSELAINVGFEPQWVLIKKYDASGTLQTSWVLYDVMRGMPIRNSNSPALNPDTNSSENDSGDLHPTPTGFVLRSNDNPIAVSSASYIYVAIRRPNKPPTAGTDVLAIDTFTGSTPNYISNFAVDFVINREAITTSGNDSYVGSRLQGPGLLNFGSSAGELSTSTATYDYMNGFGSKSGSADTNKYAWLFKRASGFLSVAAWTGNGTAGRTIDHGLEVTPEFFLVKRKASQEWQAYHKQPGATKSAYFTDNSFTSSSIWNNTAPTATSITVSGDNAVNGSGASYVAFFFATLSGISKVGSYTGTGGAANVDCGFSSGARFVLIKRTDSTGDWYLWDSERGITSSTEPYLLLNESDGQLPMFDYVDPLSSGFKVNSFAPDALNATNGTYMFLAIA